MEKTGSIINIRKLLFLICMVAIVCVANESVCFGLLNESAVRWPLPTVWWNGVATALEPNYWMDPCNWNLDGNVPTADMNVGYDFGTAPNGHVYTDAEVAAGTYYTGEPNIVIIRTGEVAECNYLRLGATQTYVDLIIRGKLEMGKGPGTAYGLRICAWTHWGRSRVIVDGGTLDVNGDTDQSYMLVPSGDVNVLGQIAMGYGPDADSIWSDQYFMTITNGTVRASDFRMQKSGKVVSGPLVDINGTGQLIVKGNRLTRFSTYIGNGWVKAYGGNANYVISVSFDSDANQTTVAVAPYIAAKAHLVSPANGDTTVDWEDPNSRGYGPALTWTAGAGATGKHRVYFGTSFADVNNAGTSSSTYKGEQVLSDVNYSVLLTAVDLNGAYYWRVDENDSGAIVKGDVWQFAIRPNRIIDEFETYSFDQPWSPAGLGAIWGDGYSNGTNSTATIVKAFNEGIPQTQVTVNDGVQAMSFYYDNSYSPFISEVNMRPLSLKGCPNDWTAENVKLLTLSLHGNKTFAEKKVYVYVESNGGTHSGIVYYPDATHLVDQGNWDANALLAQGNWESYRFWAINLAEFSAQGVDLKNITKLAIGIGNKASPTAGGYGAILVDSIRLEQVMCLGQDNDADLNNDCTVDISDLELLTDGWLATSQTVDAEAPEVGPVLWYKFNETSGYSAADSSGKGNDGTLNLDNWSAGGYDGGNCLNLGNAARVVIPVTAFDANWGAECTISLWLKDPGQDDNDSMLFQFNRSDGTDRGPQVWSGATGFMAWTCGYDPVTLYKDYLWYGENTYYSNPSHPLNKWVHYAFVKSYSGKYIRVYQDGVIVAENVGHNVTGNKLDEATSSSLFTIGAWGYMSGTPLTSSYGGYYTGYINDFQIYNYALSPAQVLSLALKGDDGSITQPLVTRANVIADDIVNFKDFAVMANKWLQGVLYP